MGTLQLLERGRPLNEKLDHVWFSITYDTSQPYQLTGAFRYMKDNHWTVWVFARDILRDGLTRHAGIGDISIEPKGPNLIVTLRPHDHPLSLKFPRKGIAQFVDSIYSLIPAGSEIMSWSNEDLRLGLA